MQESALPRIEGKDHFEAGLSAGRAMLFGRGQMARATRLFSGTEKGRDRAASHEAVLEEFYPNKIKELSGISKASGIERKSVLRGYIRLAAALNSMCTNFFAAPEITYDKETYLLWNFDIGPYVKYLIGRFPFYIKRIDGFNTYLCLGAPWLFGVGVMNAEGLCCAFNSVGCRDGGEGLYHCELNNLAMETTGSVSDAADVWKNNPRGIIAGWGPGILINANTMLADKKGDGVLIECSHNHIEIVEPKAGALASANHYQFLDREAAGGADPAKDELYAGSFVRVARMWELLDIYRGRIDSSSAHAISSDHGGDESVLSEYGVAVRKGFDRIDDATICCHMWNISKHLRRLEFKNAMVEYATSKTVYSLLMNPNRLRLGFICGNPCRKLYRQFDLEDALGAKAQESLTAKPKFRRSVGKNRGIFSYEKAQANKGSLRKILRKATEALEKAF